MSDVVSPILQWLNNNPELAGLFTFIISAAESIAIIGTIVPGTIMMTGIGALAGSGVIPLYPTLIWAILGAIVGDGVSYWIGYHFKDRLHKIWPFWRYPTLLKTGEIFFGKHGSMSVFIGRFVGPVRALVPLVAGMLGMRPWKFFLANVTSAILWAPIYMAPGILLGAASLELPPEIAIHVILVLFLILLFILMCFWFVYKILILISDQINQLQNEIWRRLRNSHYFHYLTVMLQHHDPKKTHGQLSLALYFLIFIAFFTFLVVYVKLKGPPNIAFNDAFFHFCRHIRNVRLDNFMLTFTLLGQKQLLFALTGVVCLYLLFVRRWWTALHAAGLCVIVSGSIFVLKRLLHNPRPWGILHSPETYSMPSGHATLSFAIYVGLSMLIAQGLPKRARKFLYFLTACLVFLIGMSRIYLGAHWFTDVIGGWLLATAMVILVVISYQRKYVAPPKPFELLTISLATMILMAGILHYALYNKYKNDYTIIEFPKVNLTLREWWETGGSLSTYRVSLFGFPSQLINLEWLGGLDRIASTLFTDGWTIPPARDLVSTLHRIAGDVQSTQYLPLIAPQYLDKAPILILTRPLNNKKLLVLRLYDSRRVIENNGTATLYVGTVGAVSRSYSWLYRKTAHAIDVGQVFGFTLNIMNEEWEWKYVIVNLSRKKNIIALHKILLIRDKSYSRRMAP